MTIIILDGIRCIVTACISCGVPYTVPEIVYNTHRENGGFHHCPNGHSQGWDENSEANRTRRERDRLKQETARLETELLEAEARAEKAEKKVLAVRRRAASGVCPCCSRTFQNVQRHMKSKHPNVIPLAQKALP